MNTTVKASPDDKLDFSLVRGGPLFQLFRRAHLSGPALELVKFRILFIIAITWVPLLLLSAIGGHLLGGPELPFLRDIEAHVRLLIALPVLIMAELAVHQRLQPVMRTFVESGIVSAEDTPKFLAATDAAMRLRNSVPIELALLVFAATVGHWVWRSNVAVGAASWYAVPDGATMHLTLAGYWYGFVSIPIAQFILFRWYLRLLIWFSLLWRVSRLELRLVPTHPDGAGGIGFLGMSTLAFTSIVFAQGAGMAGVIATRVLYQGQELMSFRANVAGLIGFFVLIMLGPLLVFSPNLARTKRRGLIEYGTLASTYVTAFDKKWLRGGLKDEALLGSADVQSLADLANS